MGSCSNPSYQRNMDYPVSYADLPSANLSYTCDKPNDLDIQDVALWNGATSMRMVVLLSFILTIKLVLDSRGRKSAPGPFRWPLIGSLPSLGLNPLEGMARLRGRYGGIVQMYFGDWPVVILQGRDAIRSALLTNGEVFAGRPLLYSTSIASEGQSMCFNSYSPAWKVHRRLAERSLRLSGNSASFLEDCVMSEATRLNRNMQAAGNEAFDPKDMLFWAIAHVKHSLCYGNSHQDDHFMQVAKDNMELNDCYNYNGRLDFFPWLRKVFASQYEQLHCVCNRLITRQLEKEDEHLATYTDGHIRDAMDALIKLGIHDNKAKFLSERQIMHTVLEFMGAGLDIVYMSMRWTILYMAAFPEVQRKIRDEIDSVIGPNRRPHPQDRNKMPYTEAAILEALRLSSVVPLALPHETLDDVEIDGYHISGGTLILVNIHSVNSDPEVWCQPELFKPDRFLNTDGSLSREQTDKVLSFGIGRRRCVGEKFSREEMFLFLATLLWENNIRKPSDVREYNFNSTQYGLVLRPNDYKIVVTPRKL